MTDVSDEELQRVLDWAAEQGFRLVKLEADDPSDTRQIASVVFGQRYRIVEEWSG